MNGLFEAMKLFMSIDGSSTYRPANTVPFQQLYLHRLHRPDLILLRDTTSSLGCDTSGIRIWRLNCRFL